MDRKRWNKSHKWRIFWLMGYSRHVKTQSLAYKPLIIPAVVIMLTTSTCISNGICCFFLEHYNPFCFIHTSCKIPQVFKWKQSRLHLICWIFPGCSAWATGTEMTLIVENNCQERQTWQQPLNVRIKHNNYVGRGITRNLSACSRCSRGAHLHLLHFQQPAFAFQRLTGRQ